MNNLSKSDLREWHETMPESATIHYVTTPNQWQGIQVMRASHQLRRFRVTSSGHVIMVYKGNPTHCQVHNGKYTQNRVQTEGNVYLFPTSETVDATCDGQVNEDIYLKLKPGFLNDVAIRADLSERNMELVLHADPTDIHLQQIATLFDAEMTGGCLNGRLFGESLANALAIHLLRKYAVFPSPILVPKAALTPAQMRHILSFIQDNLAKDLSLQEIAAEIGYSPYHLHRLFKTAMGKPLHQYVIEERLKKAQSLLRNSCLPVAIIAAEVGFSDHGHLARHLKRTTGLTPLQLRQNKS